MAALDVKFDCMVNSPRNVEPGPDCSGIAWRVGAGIAKFEDRRGELAKP
jgi:hypothetical protein